MKRQELDHAVGQIVGAIYGDISALFPLPPLMLVPPLTLKVKKRLEQAGRIEVYSREEKEILAKEIQNSIIPLLYSLEIEPDIIEKIIPVIEVSSLKALTSLIG